MVKQADPGTPKSKPVARTVKIIPVPGAYITGVPAVPQEVTPERAKELMAYRPTAFKKA